MVEANPQEGPLVKFYRNNGRDSEGRQLSEILAWSDNRLEYVHNYIQWLFPLKTSSQFNNNAPILNEAEIAIFRTDPGLQTNVLAAFQRMLGFYGFEYQGGTGDLPQISRAANWTQQSANWLSPHNHNFLRITRILTSLKLLGLVAQANAFFKALQEVYQNLPEGRYIGSTSFGYWKAAVGNP